MPSSRRKTVRSLGEKLEYEGKQNRKLVRHFLLQRGCSHWNQLKNEMVLFCVFLIQLKNLNFPFSISIHYSFRHHCTSWCKAPLWLSSRTPLGTEKLLWDLQGILFFAGLKKTQIPQPEVLWKFVSWMREQTKSMHWHLLILRFPPQKQALATNYHVLLLIVGFHSPTKV